MSNPYTPPSFTITGATGNLMPPNITPIPPPIEAGIKPKATAVKTDPYKAAQEARILVRWLHEHIPGEEPKLQVKLTAPLDRMEKADMRLKQAKESLVRAREHAKARRARPTTMELNRVDHLIDAALMFQQSATLYMKDTEATHARYAQATKEGTKAKSPTALFKQQLDKLHVLVQALPTAPAMPLGAAENTLRAIVTLLRNIGMEVNEDASVEDQHAEA